MAPHHLAVETSRLASVLLAACTAIVVAWPATLAPAPVVRREERIAKRTAFQPLVSGLRLDVEAAWMLDPQLCLDAFVWFHTADLSATEELGVVRCWR